MPGCVMCLRLIGFAFDRYDGIKKKEDRRPDQVENALEENPSLIEVKIVWVWKNFVNYNLYGVICLETWRDYRTIFLPLRFII